MQWVCVQFCMRHTDGNQSQGTLCLHDSEKSIMREIKRLQHDLRIVRHKRKQRCRSIRVVRYEILSATHDELPEIIDVDEIDALEAESRPIAWYDDGDMDMPGWTVIAKYAENGDFALQGGHFIAINLPRQYVILDRYESHGGFCETCDYGALRSFSGIECAITSDAPNILTVAEMFDRAKLFIDPKMTMRRISEDDVDFKPLAFLYISFLAYMRKQSVYMCSIDRPEWSCRSFSSQSYILIEALQATIRGWLFRHKILYNPNTCIGHRFIMRTVFMERPDLAR